MDARLKARLLLALSAPFCWRLVRASELERLRGDSAELAGVIAELPEWFERLGEKADMESWEANPSSEERLRSMARSETFYEAARRVRTFMLAPQVSTAIYASDSEPKSAEREEKTDG